MSRVRAHGVVGSGGWSRVGFGRARGWRLLRPAVLGLVWLLVAFGAWGASADRRVRARAVRPSVTQQARRWTGPDGAGAAGFRAMVETRVARRVRPIGPRSATIRVASGASRARFELAEPAGVIRLLRLSAPHGTRANLTGTIPGLAGIGISTSPRANASETCQHLGALDACTQAEEACPLPAATWRFRLRKLRGPAGKLRLEFIVGRPEPR